MENQQKSKYVKIKSFTSILFVGPIGIEAGVGGVVSVLSVLGSWVAVGDEQEQHAQCHFCQDAKPFLSWPSLYSGFQTGSYLRMISIPEI